MKIGDKVKIIQPGNRKWNNQLGTVTSIPPHTDDRQSNDFVYIQTDDASLWKGESGWYPTSLVVIKSIKVKENKLLRWLSK